MKTKFELSVTFSKEEREAIEKAEGILETLCFTFDEQNQCDICPIHSICSQQLNGVATPHSLLYHIRNAMKVEEE